jgi:glycolate oxidase FAD binding subunit
VSPASALASDLARLLGGERVVTGEAAGAYAVDGMRPEVAVRPGSLEDLSRAMAALHAAGAAVIVRGAGSASDVGLPPRRYEAAVVMDRMDRLVQYDPDDLTAGAQAGLPLRTLQQTLLPHRQWLALDPPGAARATLGGLFAAARTGPRRWSTGAPRDKVLGVTAVLADGTVVRSGGRVVKNVAGYDLHRLYTGSCGTLAVIAEVHVRLSAQPAVHRTLIFPAGSAEQAGALLEGLRTARIQLGALELLDAPCTRGADARGAGVPWRVSTDERAWAVAALLEGEAELVEAHLEQARGLAPGIRPVLLEGGFSESFWAGVADLSAPAGSSATPDGRGHILAQVSALPSDAARLCAAWKDLAQGPGQLAANTSVHVHAHAGAGHIFVRVYGPTHDALAAAWGRVLSDLEGTEAAAQLLDAPTALKRRVPLWWGSAGPLELMKTLKHTFDPDGILAPGRLPFDT